MSAIAQRDALALEAALDTAYGRGATPRLLSRREARVALRLEAQRAAQARGRQRLRQLAARESLCEYAARARAIERYPLDPGDVIRPAEAHDGGMDGCAPAAARHVLAGALVASLATGFGFPYGCPPADTDADEWRIPGPLSREYHAGPVAEGYPADVRLYPIAEAICELALGALPARDDEAVRAQAPDELHAEVVDLAIDLLCDRDHTVAEIACGFAAWLLATWRADWAVARARRIAAFVGRRFEAR